MAVCRLSNTLPSILLANKYLIKNVGLFCSYLQSRPCNVWHNLLKSTDKAQYLSDNWRRVGCVLLMMLPAGGGTELSEKALLRDGYLVTPTWVPLNDGPLRLSSDQSAPK